MKPVFYVNSYSTTIARHYTYTHNLALSCMILLDEVTSGGVMKEIASSSNTKSQIKLKQKRAFDAQAFLYSAGLARRVVE